MLKQHDFSMQLYFGALDPLIWLYLILHYWRNIIVLEFYRPSRPRLLAGSSLGFLTSFFGRSGRMTHTYAVSDEYRTQIFIGPRYTWGTIYGSRCLSVSNSCFVDLTDVSLVDEDAVSILADDTNRVIQGNLEM